MIKNAIIENLTNLICELNYGGFTKAATIITNILHNFIEGNEGNEVNDSKYDPEVAEVAKNIVGLTDGATQNMNQGLIWEGFSSQYISTQ